MKIKSKTKVLF